MKLACEKHYSSILPLFLLGVLMMILAGCTPLVSPPQRVSPPPHSTGTITGTVKTVGIPPQPKKLTITRDNAVCGSEKISEELVVGQDNGVKWAVVSLLGAKYERPSEKAVLDQKGCQFTPRVAVVPVGEELYILNNDGILYNIHTYSRMNPPVNMAQPGFKKEIILKFMNPEVIKTTSDVHPWMSGWIFVTTSPTIVTDQHGAFRITDVPPGTYQLKVWHEILGETTREVNVVAGQEARVTIEMGKK